VGRVGLLRGLLLGGLQVLAILVLDDWEDALALLVGVSWGLDASVWIGEGGGVLGVELGLLLELVHLPVSVGDLEDVLQGGGRALLVDGLVFLADLAASEELAPVDLDGLLELLFLLVVLFLIDLLQTGHVARLLLVTQHASLVEVLDSVEDVETVLLVNLEAVVRLVVAVPVVLLLAVHGPGLAHRAGQASRCVLLSLLQLLSRLQVLLLLVVSGVLEEGGSQQLSGHDPVVLLVRRHHLWLSASLVCLVVASALLETPVQCSEDISLFGFRYPIVLRQCLQVLLLSHCLGRVLHWLDVVLLHYLLWVRLVLLWTHHQVHDVLDHSVVVESFLVIRYLLKGLIGKIDVLLEDLQYLLAVHLNILRYEALFLEVWDNVQ
jgi:hypothetical protein